MGPSFQTWFAVSGIFLSVTTITIIIGSSILRRQQIRGRLGADAVAATNLPGGTPPKIIDRIDDKLVGLNPEERTRLRFDLLRAGYFTFDAPKIFIVIRVLLTIGLPLGGFILLSLFATSASPLLRWLLIGLLFVLGYGGPAAYVSRRQGRMLEKYRIAFPDFLDLLLVCVDAGLSLDAALVRVGPEFASETPEFARNLALLTSEMRSGRSMTEALDSLCDRLGLDEAKAFSTLLKQSLELGSNIGDALRTYADEMRDKRMTRAETKANLLPVKMNFPLGAFIFPVMLIVTFSPSLIRIAHAFVLLINRVR
jgi:tight adherence protein C